VNTSKAEDEPSKLAGEPGADPARRRISLVDHRIESRDLFIGTREIAIGHGDDVYRLRLTAQNKLILTK
jgi:hemin uptake protein HemP